MKTKKVRVELEYETDGMTVSKIVKRLTELLLVNKQLGHFRTFYGSMEEKELEEKILEEIEIAKLEEIAENILAEEIQKHESNNCFCTKHTMCRAGRFVEGLMEKEELEDIVGDEIFETITFNNEKFPVEKRELYLLKDFDKVPLDVYFKKISGGGYNVIDSRNFLNKGELKLSPGVIIEDIKTGKLFLIMPDNKVHAKGGEKI